MTMAPLAPTLEPVLKAAQVAQHLGCTPETVYILAKEGKLRSIRVGRLLRFPESALVEFIEGRNVSQ